MTTANNPVVTAEQRPCSCLGYQANCIRCGGTGYLAMTQASPPPDEMVKELAECLKRTVRLARAYSHGTGSVFEDAMRDAERLADRVGIEGQG